MKGAQFTGSPSASFFPFNSSIMNPNDMVVAVRPNIASSKNMFVIPESNAICTCISDAEILYSIHLFQMIRMTFKTYETSI